MPALFNFEVHTPYHLFYNGKAEYISLILGDGEIGVYAHHSPFTAPVQNCILHIRDDRGKTRHAFITNGILEVKDHKTVLIVGAAEWPEEINEERALAAKQKAEDSLGTAILKFEIDNAKAKFSRADLRLKAAKLKNQEKVQ